MYIVYHVFTCYACICVHVACTLRARCVHMRAYACMLRACCVHMRAYACMLRACVSPTYSCACVPMHIHAYLTVCSSLEDGGTYSDAAPV